MGCAGRKADSQSNPFQRLHTQALDLQSAAVGLVCSTTEAVPMATEVIVYNHHRKTLQSPPDHEKQLWLQPVKTCVKVLFCILSTGYLQTVVTTFWNLTSDRDDCLHRGMTTVSSLTWLWNNCSEQSTASKLSVFIPSAAKPWGDHPGQGDPLNSCDFVSFGS